MTGERHDRREALRVLGAGAAGVGVAWTAPAVLSTTAAAAATAPPGCPPCGVELVTNGSWEDGDTGWSLAGGNGSIPYAIVVPNIIPGPPSGPGVVPGTNLFGGQGGASVSQTISGLGPCVGQTYRFGFYAKAWQGTGSVTLTFVGSAAPPVVTTIPNSAAGLPMALFVATAALPAGTTAVTITMNSGDTNKLLVDLVSFTIVCTPPPCTPCGVELVTNGSWEDGDTGWSLAGGNGSIPYAIVVPNIIPGPPSGPGVVPGTNLFGGQGGVSVSQTISGLGPCVGQTYRFGFYAKAWQGTGSVTLTFVGSAAPPVVTTIPNSAAGLPMALFVATAALPAGTTAVTITMNSGDTNKLLVDLMSFTIACAP